MWLAKQSTAPWRLWVSCSKPQSDKKHWPSTHFCRDPSGIIVFDFVKGTSVMTGAFSRAPQDVDLAVSPRWLPWGGHVHYPQHTHTHTGVHVPPTFQVTAPDPSPRKDIQTKRWRNTITAGFLLNCKTHSSATALCQDPKISNRIQNCTKEWSVNL